MVVLIDPQIEQIDRGVDAPRERRDDRYRQQPPSGLWADQRVEVFGSKGMVTSETILITQRSSSTRR